MRTFIIALLLVATGCATPRAPEPAAPAPARPPVQAEPAPARPAEQPAAPAPEPSAPAAATPLEQKLAFPAHKPAPSPSTALAAPGTVQEMPVPAQPAPVPGPRELPVPDHKLEGLAKFAAENDEKLLNVFVGMERRTVEGIMAGSQNPYKREMITGSDGQVYDVLFYLTREPRKGKPISERMLTPVIFRKGQVVAMGIYPLKKLRRTGTLARRPRATASGTPR